MPAVVFVTAYDQYALRAFEVHALDYLLKPFSAERFRAALGHAREHLAQRRANDDRPPDRGRAAAARTGAAAPAQPPDGQVGRTHPLRPHRRHRLVRGGRQLRARCTSGSRSTWCATRWPHLESQLDPQQFVRIHRSTIVNVDRIQEMQSSFNGEYVVLLRNGTRLTLSRGYRDAIQARLGKPL